MPYAVDEEALNNPNLKVLDISKPPMKLIPHAEFPKMVYLHPVDKKKQHKTKIVANLAELESAQAKGYKTNPHIPVEPETEIESGEYEVAETRRGPGRPKNIEAA